MNKFEKIDDSMLNEVSGGTYHNIKPAAFVNVRDVPGGNTCGASHRGFLGKWRVDCQKFLDPEVAASRLDK